MAKISNKIKVKNADGTFEDIQISYIGPNGTWAEGNNTTASGDYSHTEGNGTIASSNIQHVQGQYNIEDANNTYAHIVGNGISHSTRSNAHTLDWDGNAWFAGEISIGSKYKKLICAEDIYPEGAIYITTIDQRPSFANLSWEKVEVNITGLYFWKRILNPSIISFTIDGESFPAEEGMKWSEWCARSDLNKGEYFKVDGAFIREGEYYLTYYGDKLDLVDPNHLIQKDFAYLTSL